MLPPLHVTFNKKEMQVNAKGVELTVRVVLKHRWFRIIVAITTNGITPHSGY